MMKKVLFVLALVMFTFVALTTADADTERVNYTGTSGYGKYINGQDYLYGTYNSMDDPYGIGVDVCLYKNVDGEIFDGVNVEVRHDSNNDLTSGYLVGTFFPGGLINAMQGGSGL